MKKIRVTIPKYMGDILKYDALEFEVSKNFLLNDILSNYKKLLRKEELVFEGEKEVIQFNLNKENENIYEDIYGESKFETEASFMRALIYGYISKSKVIRERIIFDKIIKTIEKGIKNKKKIKIKFKDGENIINPYNILYSSMEVSNYLFCSCEKNQIRYRNYRLCNIKYAFVLNQPRLEGDIEYLKKVKKDFDPFLSYGKEVVIKLSEEGIFKYNRIKTNRPKFIEKVEEIKDNNFNKYYEKWIVEGSDEKIKRYFSYFMGDIEIISPINLRQWYKEEIEKLIRIYKK